MCRALLLAALGHSTRGIPSLSLTSTVQSVRQKQQQQRPRASGAERRIIGHRLQAVGLKIKADDTEGALEQLQELIEAYSAAFRGSGTGEAALASGSAALPGKPSVAAAVVGAATAAATNNVTAVGAMLALVQQQQQEVQQRAVAAATELLLLKRNLGWRAFRDSGLLLLLQRRKSLPPQGLLLTLLVNEALACGKGDSCDWECSASLPSAGSGSFAVERLRQALVARGERPLIIIPGVYFWGMRTSTGGAASSAASRKLERQQQKQQQATGKDGGTNSSVLCELGLCVKCSDEVHVPNQSKRCSSSSSKMGAEQASSRRIGSRKTQKLTCQDKALLQLWQQQRCLFVCGTGAHDDHYHLLATLRILALPEAQSEQQPYAEEATQTLPEGLPLAPESSQQQPLVPQESYAGMEKSRSRWRGDQAFFGSEAQQKPEHQQQRHGAVQQRNQPTCRGANAQLALREGGQQQHQKQQHQQEQPLRQQPAHEQESTTSKRENELQQHRERGFFAGERRLVTARIQQHQPQQREAREIWHIPVENPSEAAAASPAGASDAVNSSSFLHQQQGATAAWELPSLQLLSTVDNPRAWQQQEALEGERLWLGFDTLPLVTRIAAVSSKLQQLQQQQRRKQQHELGE
ncbi:hypothetical protein cyc_00065 [Cyclospora cayetanensis]|uniref:Uncharacterized protein n=1 Tax=Cyclospora cayetanensis TaxID=88456 RepID=A0A1D3CVH8_9EIME|nr:hypothetical protein cyc_00065 [Cyclospora cayetanensis]